MPLRPLVALGVLLVACSSEAPEPTDAAIPAELLEPLADGASDSWRTFAGAFFSTYCPSCHGGASSAARDYGELSDVRADGAAIRCGIATRELPGCEGDGAAPPREFPRGDGPFPSDAQRERIVAWIEAGMPE